MRDCCYERDSGIEERDREIIPYTNREPGCPLTRVHEKIDLPSP